MLEIKKLWPEISPNSLQLLSCASGNKLNIKTTKTNNNKKSKKIPATVSKFSVMFKVAPHGNTFKITGFWYQCRVFLPEMQGVCLRYKQFEHRGRD